MKIIVNKEPIDDVPGFNSDYEIKAEFTGSEEATAEDLINMVFDAMLLEGYMSYSIIKAMLCTAQEKAAWFDIDFDKILNEINDTEIGFEDIDLDE